MVIATSSAGGFTDRAPDGDVRVLLDELAGQRAAAARRVHGRARERREHEAALHREDGLTLANESERVAKRLDRLSRYYTGGDPAASPSDESAQALVDAALERVARVLGAERSSRAMLEKVVNTPDFVGVRYLDAGVVAQHAVGRVHVRDARGLLRGYGTGFLVSPRLLLTNHHVLPTAGLARSSAIEFNSQDGVDGTPLAPAYFALDPDAFFVADRTLDFALVGVRAPADELAGFGFCHLTAAQGTVLIGECVTIVQHPRGEKKQIALRENRLIDIPGLVLHYSADTEPGSSGSPAFNDQWEVVALHHASVPTPHHGPDHQFLNEGIRISRIVRFLADEDLPLRWCDLLAEALTAPQKPGTRAATWSHRSPAPTDTVERNRSDSALPRQDVHDGSVTVDLPLRQTVSLDRATLAAPTLSVHTGAPGGRPPADAREAVSIDPDYSTRDGYDPDFLAHPLPLPDVADRAPVASAELRYDHFSIVMHRRRRLAQLTAVNIDGAQSQRPRRERGRWILDPRLPVEEQAGEAVYRSNDLDRGHLVRRLDPAWGPQARAANDDTFHFTNCVPQHHDFNAGHTLWLGLEDHVLHNAETADLAISVLTGPVLDAGDPQYRGVQLPRQYWKIVAMVTTSGALSVTGYLLSRAALLGDFTEREADFAYGAYRTFQVQVRRIAGLAGLELDRYAAADPLEQLEGTVRPRELLRPEDVVLTL